MFNLHLHIKRILTLIDRAQKGEDRGNDQVSLSSGFNTLSDMSESLPLDSMALGYEGYYLNVTNSCKRELKLGTH